MAKQLAKALEPYQPLFIEEPLLCEHPEAIKQLTCFNRSTQDCRTAGESSQLTSSVAFILMHLRPWEVQVYAWIGGDRPSDVEAAA
jgi:hypothetical protein